MTTARSRGKRALDGFERLLIDGNNLLRRERQDVGDAAVRGLLARLQNALPAGVHATVMLDGYSAPGSPPTARVGPSLALRHSGSRSADDAILEALDSMEFTARAATLVITDDRALTERVRTAGARARRLHWLQDLLAGRTAVSGGGRRPPGLGGGQRARMATDAEADTEPSRWQPGRGATRKKGNPRRGPRLRG